MNRPTTTWDVGSSAGGRVASRPTPAPVGMAGHRCAAYLEKARWAEHDATACANAGAHTSAEGLRRQARQYRNAAAAAGCAP